MSALYIICNNKLKNVNNSIFFDVTCCTKIMVICRSLIRSSVFWQFLFFLAVIFEIIDTKYCHL